MCYYNNSSRNNNPKTSKEVIDDNDSISTKSSSCCSSSSNSLLSSLSPSSSSSFSSFSYLAIIVALYVLSGCCQPIMMVSIRHAGLADPKCQLYMLFYYLGPASAIFLVLFEQKRDGDNNNASSSSWPSSKAMIKTCSIVLFDIIAQMMNYTGASLAGPTIFAIVYSSVTAWAALYSQLFLGRRMDKYQWLSVLTVFIGLSLTVIDTRNDTENNSDSDVWHGLLLVVIGSSMHGLFYVMSEAIMTTGEQVSVQHTCALQGITAAFVFLTWQIVYTIPHFDTNIYQPMQLSSTTNNNTIIFGFLLLCIFTIISFIHSITFFYTLRHFPGGATSAGVFKGLQAVLVFVFTDWIYCGTVGTGDEMCFSQIKFSSLVIVTAGVIWYGIVTKHHDIHKEIDVLTVDYNGYEKIEDVQTLLLLDDGI